MLLKLIYVCYVFFCVPEGCSFFDTRVGSDWIYVSCVRVILSTTESVKIWHWYAVEVWCDHFLHMEDKKYSTNKLFIIVRKFVNHKGAVNTSHGIWFLEGTVYIETLYLHLRLENCTVSIWFSKDLSNNICVH
jgi:hypothetical protein